VCVASGYTRYDEYAVEQIHRSIDLVTYRDFGGELFALELVHASRSEPQTSSDAPSTPRSPGRTVSDLLEQATPELTALFEQLDAYLNALGDDVSRKATKQYFAYRRLKNFACVEVHPQSRNLLVYLKVNPDDIALEEGYSRDVRNIGHFGTGDLELRISTQRDLDRSQSLLEASYANS
jgi:predicted transport protein